MGDISENDSSHSDDWFLKAVAGEPLRLAPDTVLYKGRFEIKQLLGSGGMGDVYKAFDKVNENDVAVKFLPSIDSSSVYRFKQEFRSLSHVVHRNLVGLHGIYSDGDRWFFTMELVPGDTLLNQLGSEPDEISLQRAFAQLIKGIQAIHKAGKLHRDLKPSNVFMTPEGRVVILDFGLVCDQKPGGVGRTIVEEGWSGTPQYMAPEQCAGEPASCASDLYAFGVMLFEALTGHLPFEGDRRSIVTHKQMQDAPRPSSIRKGVPKELDELCIQLLRRDPDARPDCQHIIKVLRPDDERLDPSILKEKVLFVGRTKELEMLQKAFEATDKGLPVVVFIHGVSGVGKTTLVEQFVSGLQQQGKAVVLTGRCYERESVPFKTCDSLIDALSRYLKQLSSERTANLLPRHVHALAQLFPALQRLDPIRKLKQRRLLPPDPNERRRVAFTAFKELLANIAYQEPLILCIDDLQWSDVDGARLLSAAITRPDPPPLLLIGSFRNEDVDTSAGLLKLRKSVDQIKEVKVREIELRELSEGESYKLASNLLPEKLRDRATRIAQEAQGSPILIRELVRYAAAQETRIQKLGLQNAIMERVASLPDTDRAVLEAICVSARPIEQSLLRAVINNSGVITALRRLLADQLVRQIASGTSSKVTTYHDRIRESIVERMDAEYRKSWHSRLALAIETSDNPDLIALTEHWRDAGEALKAGTWAVKAADRAKETLAFENAARFYQIALALNPGDREHQRTLQAQLGIALSNTGRGLRAARVFMQAAEGARPDEELELRYQAAYQWMISGHLNEGSRELDKVLRTVGLKLRSRSYVSIIDLLVNRVWIRLCGLDFRERRADQVSTKKMLELRACGAVGQGYGVADTLQATAFSSRRLRRALQSGIIEEIAKGMAVDAIFRATEGAHNRSIVEDYLKRAHNLSERISNPEVPAYLEYGKGVSAFCLGELPLCVQHLKRAEKMYIERCTGVTFNIDLINAFLGMALCYLGSWQELQQHWDACIKNAQGRDDLFLSTTQRTWVQGPIRWLAADRVDEAREHLSRGLAEWPWPQFDTQRFGAIFEALIDLYAGDYRRAFDIAEDISRRFFKSSFRRVQYLRVRARIYLAYAALAFASMSSNRKPLLTIVRKQARKLARERFPLAEPFVPYIKGRVLGLNGDEENAVKLLREAAGAFTHAQYKLFAAATNRRLGGLLGGDEGRVLIAQADATMKEQSVVNPERVAAMLAPGFSE